MFSRNRWSAQIAIQFVVAASFLASSLTSVLMAQESGSSQKTQRESKSLGENDRVVLLGVGQGGERFLDVGEFKVFSKEDFRANLHKEFLGDGKSSVRFVAVDDGRKIWVKNSFLQENHVLVASAEKVSVVLVDGTRLGGALLEVDGYPEIRDLAIGESLSRATSESLVASLSKYFDSPKAGEAPTRGLIPHKIGKVLVPESAYEKAIRLENETTLFSKRKLAEGDVCIVRSIDKEKNSFLLLLGKKDDVVKPSASNPVSLRGNDQVIMLAESAIVVRDGFLRNSEKLIVANGTLSLLKHTAYDNNGIMGLSKEPREIKRAAFKEFSNLDFSKLAVGRVIIDRALVSKIRDFLCDEGEFAGRATK